MTTAARYLIGGVFARLADIPDQSVDLVMTSPPFLALRSYLPADHPDKAKEIGSEATPAEFLDTLLALTAELGRVLAPHGSICVELGDTYAGSGGAGGDYSDQGLRSGQAKFDGSGRRNRPADVAAGILAPTKRPGPEGRDKMPGWPLAKSLTGIPTLYAWSLAYGRNLLTGEPSPAGQWRIRNLVAWVRTNPPVGALGDKFRPATSYLTVATKARDRWFDLDAVRTPTQDPPRVTRVGPASASRGIAGGDSGNPNKERPTHNPAGAPPLDWWNIPPRGYTGSHYAVFPAELCERPIQAMCPRRVCTTCGTPSRRITRIEQRDTGRTTNGAKNVGRKHESATDYPTRTVAEVTTTGWSTCGCPGTDGSRLDGHHTGTGWRPGHVLDPFAGTGTTLLVATGLGRTATGIDLDARNADLARQRLGMFLTVDQSPVKETP